MFKSKVVAITGAGSGIGQALCVELAKRGATLALSDINETAMQETLALLPAGTEARAYPLDVSSQDAVFAFAEAVKIDFGTADFIINNAGTAILATIENVTLSEIEKVLAINLWGVIYGTKAFLPIMLRQKSGCIVNISSVFGLVATPASGAYTISKFAVRGLTETLWQELQGTGVRAVVVHPGGIKTNISGNPVGKFASDFERHMVDLNMRQMITPPAVCAKQIADGLESGKPRLLVGNGAKSLHLLSRLFPNRYVGIVRRKLGV